MRSILATEDFAGGQPENENLLWRRFKEGDRSAYAYFYSKYSCLLFRYGCKILSDREVVKDCLHDLYTELWRNKVNLGSPISVKNYLLKSFRNKLVRELSKQSKFVAGASLAEIDFGLENSAEFKLIDNQSKSQQEQKLVCAMRKLTNRQKEVIFLLYYNSLTPAEVAAIMSVSVRTIYNTTFSAIQLLKGELVAVMLLIAVAGGNAV